MATANAGGVFFGVSARPGAPSAVLRSRLRIPLLLLGCILALALLTTRSARAEGFGPNTDWGARLCTGAKQCRLGYFNNDGYVDVLVYDPTSGTTLEVAAGSVNGFGGPTTWYSSTTAFSWIRVGDFDGDGLTDVVASPGTGVGVLASTGSSFANYSQWYSGTLSFHQIEVGDVDNDGDEDLVTFSHWPEYDVGVALSTTAGFSTPTLWHGWFGGDVVRVGDIDGDGEADVVGFWGSNEVYAALSNGQNAFGPQVTLWHNWFGGDEPNLADVNLDGKKDAVAFSKWTGDVWVTYSDGTKFGPSVSQMHNDFCNNVASCMPGDVNGDGAVDLLGFAYSTAGGYEAEHAYASLRQACGVFDPLGTSCADAVYCNGAETCHADYSCSSDSTPADDGNACTLDECSGTAESHTITHTPINPDDLNVCTVDWCVPLTGTQHAPALVGTACGDGDLCNGLELCAEGGRCETASSASVDDGNPCTLDTCSDDGITHAYVAEGTPCIDWDPCNGTETCIAGSCTAGAPPQGPSCYVCTLGRDGGPDWTTPASSGTACNDSNLCTVNDACDGSGNCSGTLAPSGTSCGDGNPCNGDETCNASGACQAGTSPSLDDSNPCTEDTCSPPAGVTHTPKQWGTQCVVQGVTKACDGAGRCVLETSEQQPPTPVVTALDPSVSPEFANSTAFIYTGATAIQKKADGTAVTLNAAQVGVIRGRVLGRDDFGGAGNEIPLPKVKVTLPTSSAHGQTYTREDGQFELAVEGGKYITLEFDKPGYLPAQRTMYVPQHDYEVLEDVILVQRNPNASTVSLCTLQSCAAFPYSLANGAQVSEDIGGSTFSRKGRLLVMGNTSAIVQLTGGGSTQASSLSVRITEYTSGSNGSKSMPAALPVSSGYTYAVDLSADGADSVQFTPSVPYYVENFLDFKVGATVPVGYYDRSKQAWIAAQNGRVIKIVSYTNGKANIDIDGEIGGDASAEEDSELAAIGITLEERQALDSEQMYPAETELWRVPIAHFTPYDFNWSAPPPPCSSGGPCADDDPGGPPPSSGSGSGGGGGPEGGGTDGGCEKGGSIIECDSQVLREGLPIAGSPLKLAYSSRQVPGYGALNTISFKLPATTKALRKRFETELYVAGRRVMSDVFPTSAAGQSVSYVWDGLDAFGRKVNGYVTAVLRIREVYPAYYYQTSTFGLPPASGATSVGGNLLADQRTEVVGARSWHRRIGSFDGSADGLGGWRLDAVHWYDPDERVLHKGDGTRYVGAAIGDIASTLVSGSEAGGLYLAAAPDGALYQSDHGLSAVKKVLPDGSVSLFAGMYGQSGYSCDECAATSAKLNAPRGVAVGADGSVYVADGGNHRIRRVDPAGNIHTVVGNGTAGQSDGALASALVAAPSAVAVGPDGSLVIADGGVGPNDNSRVRLIDAARERIQKIAGSGAAWSDGANCGALASYDGASATTVPLSPITGVSVTSAGSVYVLAARFVWEIRADGTIFRKAGACTETLGDGGPARNASLSNAHAMALAPDGTIFVSAGARVRRIDVDGNIRTVAGNGLSGNVEDGAFATATPFGTPFGLAIAPDGALFVQQTYTSSYLRKVVPALPGRPLGTDLMFPSSDRRETYVFDAEGRHIETRDTASGAALMTVSRDAAKRISAVTLTNAGVADPQTNLPAPVPLVTTIQRDVLSGAPTKILGPFGHETGLGVDASGRLASVTYPVDSDGNGQNDTVQLTHSSDGLLTKLVDARGGTHIFKYDGVGALIEDRDPAGGIQTISRPPAEPNRVDHTLNGLTTSYTAERLGSGALKRTVTGPDLLTSSIVVEPSGISTTTLSDGTVLVAKRKTDPVLGALASYKTDLVTSTGGLTKTILRTRVLNGTPINPVSLTETTTIDLPTGVDPVRTEVYDFNARTSTSTSAQGRPVVRTFDSGGRLRRMSRPGVVDTVWGFDGSGRPSSISQGTRAAQISYHDVATGDARSGYIKDITLPIGGTVAFTPDGMGRTISRTISELGLTTALKWDAAGNLRSVTPPEKLEHKLAHTPVDRLAAYAPPDLGPGTEVTTYEYGPDRRLKSALRPDGTLITYDYDSAGRLDLVSSPLGALDYSYYPASPPSGGAAGRVKQVSGPNGVTTDFQYFGMLPKGTSWSGSVSGSVSRTYDGAFRIASETISSGASSWTHTFGYDLDGLLTCASPTTCPAGTNALNVDYDSPASSKNGLLRALRVSGSVGEIAETFTYDSYGEFAGHALTVAGTPVASFTYDEQTHARDALGRITRKTEVVGSTVITWDFSYDGAGRLEKVWKNGSLEAHYIYDGNGNRMSIDGGANTVASYDAQDRLVAYATASFEYGANGELSKKRSGSAVTTYTYDPFGSLRSVTLPNGKAIQYLTDANGRRVAKKEDGVLTRQWLYRDGWAPAAELDGAGALRARFIYASHSNVPDLMIDGSGAVFRIVTDYLGSVRLVVRLVDGAVVQQVDYDAWGKPTLTLGSWTVQPFGFAGGLYDHETELARFGARDYDSVLGRWISKDPSRFAGGLNLYTYSHNDPVNWFDITGRTPLTCAHAVFRCIFYCTLAAMTKSGAAMGACTQSCGTAGAICQLDIDDKDDELEGWDLCNWRVRQECEYGPDAGLGACADISQAVIDKCGHKDPSDNVCPQPVVPTVPPLQ